MNITNVKEEDGGEFMCTAQNIIGKYVLLLIFRQPQYHFGMYVCHCAQLLRFSNYFGFNVSENVKQYVHNNLYALHNFKISLTHKHFIYDFAIEFKKKKKRTHTHTIPYSHLDALKGSNLFQFKVVDVSVKIKSNYNIVYC